MKVRYSLLPGEVLTAKVVLAPSMFARDETTPVLELDAGAPVQVAPPGTDCEIVEATDEERARLRDAGYPLRDAPPGEVVGRENSSQMYGWAILLVILFLLAITLYGRS